MEVFMKKLVCILSFVMLLIAAGTPVPHALAGSNVAYESYQSPNTLPDGLAWDGEQLWSVDFGAHTVYALSTEGEVISEFPSPCHLPTGLAWDGCCLWHADASGEIVQTDTSGNVIEYFSMPGCAPEGLAWDGFNLWMVDGENKLIVKLDSDCNPVITLNAPGPHPSGLAWNGVNLVHADSELQWIYFIDPDYVYDSITGGYPAPGTDPRGLAWGDSVLWNSDMSGGGTIMKITGGHADQGTRLFLPANTFAPGDIFYTDALFWNPRASGPGEGARLFVILELYGQYYFAPDFSDYDFYSYSSNRTAFVPVIPKIVWPEIASGEATFYGAMTDAGSYSLIGEIASFHFGWHE